MAAVAIAVWSNTALADDQEGLVRSTRETFSRLQARLTEVAPDREALRISAVRTVLIPDAANYATPVATISNEGRNVWFTFGYLARLWACTSAFVTESTFKDNRLTSDLWLKYDVHSLGFVAFQGQERLPLEVYANLSVDEQRRAGSAEFQGKVATLFEQGVEFVLAHELGHHALDEFYTFDSPPSETKTIEEKVDNWALAALAKMGVVPLAGATVTIGCLDGQSPHSFVPSEFSSHPGQAERILQALTSQRHHWREIYRKAPYSAQPLDYYLQQESSLASILRRQISRERSDGRGTLEARLDRHGSEADQVSDRIATLVKLARYYQFGWGIPKDPAIRHAFLAQAARAGDPWAQYAIAYDFDTGQGVPFDGSRAFVGYTWLAAAGYKPAIGSLAGLPKRTPIQKVCEGSCRVGNFVGPFRECLESRKSACMSSCTSQFDYPKSVCEHRLCSMIDNYVHWYPRCEPTLPPPSLDCVQDCVRRTSG